MAAAGLLPALIGGAIDILTKKDAFKDNIKKTSTGVGAATILAGQGTAQLMPPDSLEQAIVQIVSGLLGVGLILLRDKRKTG